MRKGSRQVRIQEGGAITALSKAATHQLASRAGTWDIEEGPTEVLLMRRIEGAYSDANLRLAGQIHVAGALCDILALIGQSGWTGSLVVHDDVGTRTLEFDGGRVVAAASTVRLERFGELVYRFGLATREQIDAARHAAAISGTSLAESLAEQELVDDGALEPVQRRHVEEIFYATVRAKRGCFYFFDKRLLGHDLPRPHPTAVELLMEGARRMDEMLVFRAHVPSERHVPEVVSGRGDPPPELAEILGRCNGKRSVADVGRHVGMLEYEITQAMVRLVEGGYVTMRMSRPRGIEQITEVFNTALVEIHRSCDRAAVGEELREGLKRFITGTPAFAALVSAAGPLDDGSFAPERVARNLMARPTAEPVGRLVKLLQDFTGFALFLGTSLVPREESVAVKALVGDALKPIERASHSIAPASAPPRRRVPAAPRPEQMSGEFRITLQSTPPSGGSSGSGSKKKTASSPPSSTGGRARSR
jgi:hypothetical protein